MLRRKTRYAFSPASRDDEGRAPRFDRSNEPGGPMSSETTEAATTTGRLSDADLERLIAMLDQVDSVELKLTVPASDQRKISQALGLDPLDAVIRQVFFFDTPDLTLFEHGLVVRARRTQGRSDDSTIKLRPVVPNELPRALRLSREFAVEIDAMPGGFVCSGSYSGELSNVGVRDVLSAGQRVRKLYSKEQRDFFAAHAPEGVGLDDLTLLG